MDSIVGVDCGFDNPNFATIKLDYFEVDHDSTKKSVNESHKHITFYKLDIGINHVMCNQSGLIDNGVILLVMVPKGGYGASGVLVCDENFVIYKNQGYPYVHAFIP